ncbi:ERV/ALR sulfhydryl oxidase domain-containing protein [Hyaloraphidium curvatum]|nr:ERV/ALR sulfhydryl oxidase domain-containing protein [Hyaloraphidium curvatum]
MASLTSDLHPTDTGGKPAKAGKKKKPCRVCAEFNEWGKEQTKDASSGAGTKPSDAGAKAAVVAGAALVSASQATDSGYPTVSSSGAPCPPDSGQLGRTTWTFLHTMAAYYPDHPTDTQQKEMSGLITGLSKFYPCHYCADHLQKEMKVHPPAVTSRTLLSRWFCDIHNEVNVRLGKPVFDCSKVDERWRDGPADGSCD